MSRAIIDELLIEQKFPAENMTISERDFYIDLIRNCKDIKNPDNLFKPINGELIEMHLKKVNNIILFNGSVHYKLENTSENRCIDGAIYEKDKALSVTMNVIRLVNVSNKEYTIVDEFVPKDGVMTLHNSNYSFDKTKNYKEEIEFNMEGRKL